MAVKEMKKQRSGLSLTPQQKFNITRKELSEGMIERNEEVDMILTAMLCGENPLLVGPPGTGKSYMIDLLLKWVHPAEKFSVLFSKFTVPEEVFGPISVKGLENDNYYRIVNGMLPAAQFGFGDEIFKSSSAILNTLLKVLNEKVYKNGKDNINCPLIMFLGASNEWPSAMEGGAELGALFDRFLFRKTVHYITSPEGRSRLLWAFEEPQFSTTITPQEINRARMEKDNVNFSKEAVEAFAEILDNLGKEGITASDRRQRKSVDACRAFAYLSQSKEVEKEHLEILSHILWSDPIEQPKKCAQIVSRVANPIGSKVAELVTQAREVLVKNNGDDVISKLREIQESFDNMDKYGAKHTRLSDARKWIARLIKSQLMRASGIKEE